MGRIVEAAAYQSPLLSTSLSAEVRAECEKSFMDGSPWTKIRPLQKGVDASDHLTCDGAAGDRKEDCSAKVEAVQYSSAQGEVQHYCEKHALMQNEWDIVHYYSEPAPVPDLTKDQIARIEKLLEKKKSKKQREKEALQKEMDETDLMA
jgi:hypothetical protein